jgi:hypothetical protein
LTKLTEYQGMAIQLAEVAQDAWCCTRFDGKRRRYGKLGRPRGSNNFAFDYFVRDLLESVEDSGGHLTFTKADGGRGTLLDALQVIADHLPPGFVPSAAPISRLDRIVLLWRRNRRSKQSRGNDERINPAAARRVIRWLIDIGIAASRCETANWRHFDFEAVNKWHTRAIIEGLTTTPKTAALK